MKFEKFLSESTEKNFWDTQRVIVLQAQDEAPLFISTLCFELQAQGLFNALPTRLACDELSKDALIATLSQEFLGQECFYLLTGLGAKKRVSRKSF